MVGDACNSSPWEAEAGGLPEIVVIYRLDSKLFPQRKQYCSLPHQ